MNVVLLNTDVEVGTFLLGGFSTERSDDEMFAGRSPGAVAAKREFRKHTPKHPRHRSVVVDVEEIEFSAHVLLDSTVGSSAPSRSKRGFNVRIETPLPVQMHHLVCDAWHDGARLVHSSQNGGADGEVKFLADLANCSGRTTDEGDLGQMQLRELLRICAFEVKDAHLAAVAGPIFLELILEALVLD